jgi:hypothetical protein
LPDTILLSGAEKKNDFLQESIHPISDTKFCIKENENEN